MAQRQFKPTYPVGGALFPPVIVGDAGTDPIQYLPSYLLGKPSKAPKENLSKEALKPSSNPSNVRRVQQTKFEASSASQPSRKGPSFTSTPIASLQKAGPPKHGLGSAAPGLTTTPAKRTHSEESGRGHWITVSGFLPAKKSQVFEYFSSIGSIVQYTLNPGCNWMHLRYINSKEAKKALSKNGSVFDDSMRITVEKFDGQIGLTGASRAENSLKCQIRPLANNYMFNQDQVPVRESGIISKFTELFGW